MKYNLSAAFAVAMALSPAAAAFAGETYLACTFAQPPGAPLVFHFRIDKASGKLGVYAPSTGSERSVDAVYAGAKVSANEGTVGWEIDPAARTVIRDKRMVGEKDRTTCKRIAAAESGFEN